MDKPKHSNKKKKISLKEKLIGIFALFFILVLVNLLALKVNFRVDLTKYHLYTLSDYSKELISTLDDQVNVKFYISKKLPPQAETIKQQVLDLLHEYKSHSKGNIHVQVVDPTKVREEELKLRKLGVRKFQINVTQKDKVEVVDGYAAIVVQYEDKTELLPLVLSIHTLEYDLSLAIKRLVTDSQPAIAFIGKDKNTVKRIYGPLQKPLEKLYTLNFIGYDDVVSPNISTLIVHDPENITTANAYKIDQHIMRGGKGIFLINNYEITAYKAEPVISLLRDQVSHYGINIEHNMVLDESMTMALFSDPGSYMSISLPYPFWPKLTKENFDKEHPTLARLESFVIPWSSELTFSEVPTGTIKQSVLATTSARGWLSTDPIYLSPEQPEAIRSSARKKYPVLATLKGQFTTFFKDIVEKRAGIAKSPETTLVVFGTSHFLEKAVVERNQNNISAFLNLIDWITVDSGTLSIPNRTNVDFPLKTSLPSQRLWAKWLGTLGVPLIIVLFGVLKHVLARRRIQQPLFKVKITHD